MCGKESDLLKTKVEGTILNVCEKCSKHGSVIAKVEDLAGVKDVVRPKFSRDEEISESIVSNFSSLVKNKREQMNLKQEDFAKEINEKVSVIHHIENGTLEPSIKLAKKLEKFLHIKLIEMDDFEYKPGAKESSGPMTIGDMLKIKKSK